MAKSGYRKFKKQEKAKVKLKGVKKLLPKGQNVTDVNFKIKKIIIKSQLQEHSPNEILSKRKLNIHGILSRLNHYNCNVKREALSDLISMFEDRGISVILSNLSSVVSELTKLITSSSCNFRKLANKFLQDILNQISKKDCDALYDVLISRVVCGLTDLDAGVRVDGLNLLASVVPVFQLRIASSAAQLLPVLLDLISQRHGNQNRTLEVHLNQKISASSWRSDVLRVIKCIINNLLLASSSGVGCNDSDQKVIEMEWKPGICYPIHQSFLLPHSETVLSFSDTLLLHQNEVFQLNDFVTSLIPIMLDSFFEMVPSFTDPNETECLISFDAAVLLDSISEMLLAVKQVLSQLPKKTVALQALWNRLIVNKFPYRVIRGSKKKLKVEMTGIEERCYKQNLALSSLVLSLAPRSLKPPVVSFLKGVLRDKSRLEVVEMELLFDCLENILKDGELMESWSVLGTVSKLSEHSGRALQLLRKIAVDPTYSHLHQEAEFVSWVRNIMPEMIKKETVDDETVKLVTHLSACSYRPFIDSLNVSMEAFLDTLPKIGLRMDLAGLVYWVSDWDAKLIDYLSRGIRDQHWGENISSSLAHVVIVKSKEDTNLKALLMEHDWWREKLGTG